jgi:hypothetical protein
MSLNGLIAKAGSDHSSRASRRNPVDKLPHPAPLKAGPLVFRSFFDFLIEAPLLWREITSELLWSNANWIARSDRTQWKPRPSLRVLDPFHAPYQFGCPPSARCSSKRMAVPRGSYVGLEAIAPLSNDPIAKLSASARAGPRSHGLQQPRPRGQTSENRSTVS